MRKTSGDLERQTLNRGGQLPDQSTTTKDSKAPRGAALAGGNQ